MRNPRAAFIIIVAFVLAFPQWSSAQWTQTGGPKDVWINALARTGSALFAGTSGGVFKYEASRADWSEVNTDLTCRDVRALVPAGKTLFAATGWANLAPALKMNIGGIFLSENDGVNWVTANKGLPLKTNIKCLAVSGTHLIAGAANDLEGQEGDYEDHSGLFLSRDSGRSWTNVAAGGIVALAARKTTVFAGVESLFSELLLKSEDGGKTWASVKTGLPEISAIYWLAVDGANLYAGINGGVFLSADDGREWAKIGGGLPANSQVWCFTVSGKTLFAGTENSGVYRSDDMGRSWKAFGSSWPAGASVLCLTVSDGQLYAGTDGLGVWRLPLSEGPSR